MDYSGKVPVEWTEEQMIPPCTSQLIVTALQGFTSGTLFSVLSSYWKVPILEVYSSANLRLRRNFGPEGCKNVEMGILKNIRQKQPDFTFPKDIESTLRAPIHNSKFNTLSRDIIRSVKYGFIFSAGFGIYSFMACFTGKCRENLFGVSRTVHNPFGQGLAAATTCFTLSLPASSATGLFRPDVLNRQYERDIYKYVYKSKSSFSSEALKAARNLDKVITKDSIFRASKNGAMAGLLVSVTSFLFR